VQKVAGDPTTSKRAYFEYVRRCQALARRYNYSLRDFDRVFWGTDFYEGKGGLRELVKNLK
jgi:hypothetical protein